MKVTLRRQKLGAPIIVNGEIDGYEDEGYELVEKEMSAEEYLASYQDYKDDYTVTMEDIENGDYDEDGFVEWLEEVLF